MDVRSLIAVLLAGVLTGSELTSWGIVHPTLWKLDHAEQVRAEKLMYRRFASVDPFVMTATIVACFVAATGLHGSLSALAVAAGVCYVVMLAITLGGNMPINLRVFGGTSSMATPSSGGRFVAAGTGCIAPGSCSTAPALS